MQQTKYESCGHCSNSGTCRNGQDGVACSICAQRGFFLKYKNAHGLVCSICKGTGFIEPIALRLTYRTGPVLALFVMATAIVTIVVGHENHFNEVLAFLGTLTGAITGFYFGRRD